MVQIPIISGIVTRGADFRTAYPVNLVPVPKPQGISSGYLRPAEGIITIADGAGANRGGRRWRDKHYRVMGNRFVRVDQDGTLTTIYTGIAGANWVTFAESFTHLAINAGGCIYLYDGTTLTQITDVNLGVSLDVCWTSGYFVSTDGEFLTVTNLLNPFTVSPLKYGSSETRPDPVVALMTLRNEVYAINRYTVEVFGAVTNPGLGFPFARIESAQIMKGAIGSRACCEFMQGLAFLGGGIDDPPSVWVGLGGNAQKVSTREVEQVLRSYDDATLATAVLEARSDLNHDFLYLHLPDRTLVYDGAGSREAQAPVWFVLTSGAAYGGYRARGFVWCYSRWNVADPFGTKIGYLSDAVGSHYGDLARWEFTTPVAYGEGQGAQVHELELVALTGDVATGDDPVIATQWSVDGETWSQPRYIRAGRRGERAKRLVWYRQGQFGAWRVQRFFGDSRAHLSFARIEARIEALQ